jgi:hypothetical protein
MITVHSSVSSSLRTRMEDDDVDDVELPAGRTWKMEQKLLEEEEQNMFETSLDFNINGTLEEFERKQVESRQREWEQLGQRCEISRKGYTSSS